ncbi:unnamed protein product [Nesidiocoris tenuis]|uniref:Uncharacterized protein n=1 Tax=Nesidiocoris tenuis TaxID=355587 RepID=A0A6H5GVC2_9HEMI|nr:unnamed protein product [Nesidiocoris tenuis]
MRSKFKVVNKYRFRRPKSYSLWARPSKWPIRWRSGSPAPRGTDTRVRTRPIWHRSQVNRTIIAPIRSTRSKSTVIQQQHRQLWLLKMCK